MAAADLASYVANATGAPHSALGSLHRDWRGALEAAFQSRLAALAEDASMPLCVLLPSADPAPGGYALAIAGDLSLVANGASAALEDSRSLHVDHSVPSSDIIQSLWRAARWTSCRLKDM